MRGRKPLPVELRIIHGNRGKRRLPPVQPSPDLLETAAPPELADDAEAQAEWTRTIVPAIHRRQVIATDRSCAIAHCQLWSTWRALLALAARHPEIVAVGKHKYPRPNPARVQAHSTLRLLLVVDAELGLTPASRTRVSVAVPLSGAEQLDRFLEP